MRVLAPPTLVVVIVVGVSTLLSCSDGDSSDPTASDGDTTVDSPVADAAPVTSDSGDGSSGDADGTDADFSDPDDACVPDCTDKACGSNGCGVLCGICDDGFQCTEDFQCLPFCSPEASTFCSAGAVVWLDSCDEPGDVKELCGDGSACVDGACVPCANDAFSLCVGQELVSFDDCGTPGRVLLVCGEGLVCKGEGCVPSASPLSGTYTAEVTPSFSTISIADAQVELAFDAESADIEISETGEADLTWIGGAALAGESGYGTFDGTKLDIAFSVVWTADGISYRRDVTLSLLYDPTFDGQDRFKGTAKEVVSEDDGEDPPVTEARDITLLRRGTR